MPQPYPVAGHMPFYMGKDMLCRADWLQFHNLSRIQAKGLRHLLRRKMAFAVWKLIKRCQKPAVSPLIQAHPTAAFQNTDRFIFQAAFFRWGFDRDLTDQSLPLCKADGLQRTFCTMGLPVRHTDNGTDFNETLVKMAGPVLGIVSRR